LDVASENRQDRTYSDRREQLLRSIERDREDMHRALDDLRGAARTFSPRDRIVAHPLPWMLGGLLFGLWLGSRRRARIVA
jgi:hypothetical protein